MKISTKLKKYSQNVHSLAKHHCISSFGSDDDYLDSAIKLINAMFVSCDSIKCYVKGGETFDRRVNFILESSEIVAGIDLEKLNFFAELYYKSYEIGVIYREKDLIDAIFAIYQELKLNGSVAYNTDLIQKVIRPATNPLFTDKALTSFIKEVFA